LDQRWDGELVDADREGPASVLALEHPALDEIPKGFLQEEGIAARALGEQLGDRVRQLALCRVVHEQATCIRRQRPQLDLLVPVRVALASAFA
jgi:hypothetical protein